MRTPRLKTHLLSLFSLSLFLAPGLQAADAGNAGSKSGESGVPESLGGWASLKLWYKHPAAKWTEALPVGNGRLGAMVFGKTDEERIQFNEETCWSGGPYSQTVKDGYKALPEILFQGRIGPQKRGE